MDVLGIIPARYGSSRLPGKPLANIAGKTMIQRVYEHAAQASSLTELLVATDDHRIFEHVQSFGGNVMLTAPAHSSGTDRCAEVMEKLPNFEVAINIQGDQPFLQPQNINFLCACLLDSTVALATLIKKIDDLEELINPSITKVVINNRLDAIYFSRTIIPYLQGQERASWLKRHTYYKHIGMYAYHRETLKALSLLPPSSLEKAESLEQLRWIEHGYRIKTAITEGEADSVDTPEDLINISKQYVQGKVV